MTHVQPPARYQAQPAANAAVRPSLPDRLTPAEAFWYVLGNIAFGHMYLAKVPVKKALEECGLAQMTSAERFWYVLMCVAFGAGYIAKVPVKRALTEASL
jgi:hypothetical protein